MIKSIVLDICKHELPPTNTVLLRQGDLNSLDLNMAIMEDGAPFDLADYEVQFMAALPNGKVVIDPCEKLGSNMAAYTLPPAIYASPGEIALAYVAVAKENEWIASTDCMVIRVKPGVDITAEAAEDILGHFTELKKRLDELLEQAAAQTEQQQKDWQAQMDDQSRAFDAAEAARDAEEAERAAAEAQRVAAEKKRAEAENARVSAEASRASAESDRESAESTRAKAETSRAAAEEARSDAEAQRVAAEAARVNAEKGRVSAETARATAETARVEAESLRVAAELERERRIEEALASLSDHESISNEEIDALWG